MSSPLVSQRLAGKVALVTAAAQGIGRASAERLAAEGARVIATDINVQALAGSGLEVRQLDVLDNAQVQALAAEIGPIDILFNCAGFVHAGSILDCSEADWDFSVSLNMTAMFHMCRAFLPGMIDNGGGSIINMASVAGAVLAAPNRFAYGATKAGVIGMTKSIAAEYGKQGIRANAIMIGFVLNEHAQKAVPEEIKQILLDQHLTPRLGSPRQIADVVAFLASEEASFITGATLPVDGGFTSHSPSMVPMREFFARVGSNKL